MKVITNIEEIKSYLRKLQRQGQSIGLVPTMGYLHKGHQSLIRQAAEENDLVVVSIFVNPTQFGPGEDFERYPRDLERDIQLTKEAGGHLIFAPTASEMYPQGYHTYVEVEKLTETLCGASRPGHFRGVTTVVSKLFHIVNPDRAYFGQKDAQQATVIQKMVKDLNMDVNIEVCPIVREPDGLAMSSRNTYLNLEERKQAVVLYQALSKGKEQIKQGEKDAARVKQTVQQMIEEQPLAKVDYVSIVHYETLEEVQEINSSVLLAVAVKFGKTRLIDNMIVEG